MAYEPKDFTGTLFRNDKREKDSHPHARGEAMIGGVLYEIAAWTKEGKNSKFQSLAFKPKQPRSEPPQRSYAQESGARAPEELNDDLPF